MGYLVENDLLFKTKQMDTDWDVCIYETIALEYLKLILGNLFEMGVGARQSVGKELFYPSIHT